MARTGIGENADMPGNNIISNTRTKREIKHYSNGGGGLASGRIGYQDRIVLNIETNSGGSDKDLSFC